MGDCRKLRYVAVSFMEHKIMGGRGAKSYYTQINRSSLPYSVISWHDYTGRASLPFVTQTGQAWHMLRHASDKPEIADAMILPSPLDKAPPPCVG